MLDPLHPILIVSEINTILVEIYLFREAHNNISELCKYKIHQLKIQINTRQFQLERIFTTESSYR